MGPAALGVVSMLMTPEQFDARIRGEHATSQALLVKKAAINPTVVRRLPVRVS